MLLLYIAPAIYSNMFSFLVFFFFLLFILKLCASTAAAGRRRRSYLTTTCDLLHGDDVVRFDARSRLYAYAADKTESAVSLKS